MDFNDFCIEFGQLGVTEIGVSGTRKGITRPRYDALAFAIENLHEHGAMRLHHGGATGVDSQAHWRAFRLMSSGMKVTVHPPIKKRYAAALSWRPGPVDNAGALQLWSGCEVRPDLAYGVRDWNIVNASSVLIAAPEFPHDDPRSAHSGTWLTVSFAQRERVPVYWITSEGNIEEFTQKVVR